MDIIPVIDLLDGTVVHARRGQRDAYRPISTPLSATSRPADVAAGLLRISAFRRLYVADLDAIGGRAANDAALDALASAAPGVAVWVDGGLAGADAVREQLGRDHRVVVIGSESQRDAAWMRALRDHPRVVLSLDFRGEEFQGPRVLLADASLWPSRVIVMTLARVGAGAGPDLGRVAGIVDRADGREIYAAGGVRDAADLRALSAAGASGALVATALHDGSLTGEDLAALR